MLSVSSIEIGEALSEIQLPVDHPLNDILDFDALEDAAKGGLEGARRLYERRAHRKISREELQSGKSNAEAVGYRGEVLASYYLEDLKAKGEIDSYEWVSDSNAIAPYDFTITSNGNVRYVDAKSTNGKFENAIHISTAELIEMNHSGEDYDIFRLSQVDENTAELRIASSVGPFAAKILASLQAVPKGVTIDAVSVSPSLLGFGAPINLNYDDE
jgi:hypothetical protein